jgi:uncharacterized protein YjbI with pentapeptide repeats
MKVTAKVLKERWKPKEGQSLLESVLRSLKHRSPLEHIKALERVGGRWDLRGIELPQIVSRKWFSWRDLDVDRVSGRISFSKLKLADADFSYSNLSDVMLSDCSLTNVNFGHACLRGMGFWGCSLTDTTFDNADLREAVLGGVFGGQPNTFSNVTFRKANLSKTGGGFPLYRHCDFSHANLYMVNFDGARFENCRFAGLVEDAAFRRHALLVADPVLPWQKVDPLQFINHMECVDFAEAELRDVDFDSVDLSTCIFPEDGNHLVIHNQHRVLHSTRDAVATEWTGEARDVAIRLLDLLYLKRGMLEGHPLSAGRLSQPIQVVNRLDLRDSLGQEGGDQLFHLLQKMSANFASGDR